MHEQGTEVAEPMLTGLRVLDFSKVLAGPLCTQQMADMGATVTKVEPPDGGDETRKWPPYQGGEGAVFLSVNRNKRSVALDLKRPDALDVVYRLVRQSDVVLETFAPGVADRLGIGFDRFRREKPDIVYCSISGFGQTGPLSRAPGYDLILQAFSGLLSITGEPGGPPIRSAMSPIDQAAGMNALSAILAALIRRSRTGQGARLDVSLFDSSVSLLSYVLQSLWVSGREPGKSGTGHPSLCPYQIFRASDRDILIGVPNDNLWRKFCAAADYFDYATHPSFATNKARVENYDATIATVQGWVEERTCDEWMDRLRAAGVPASPLNTLRDLIGHPHTAARGIVLDYEHARLGPMQAVVQPVVIDGSERRVGTGAPALGEQTRAVLAEVGLDEAAIETLLRNGAALSGAATGRS